MPNNITEIVCISNESKVDKVVELARDNVNITYLADNAGIDSIPNNVSAIVIAIYNQKKALALLSTIRKNFNIALVPIIYIGSNISEKHFATLFDSLDLSNFYEKIEEINDRINQIKQINFKSYSELLIGYLFTRKTSKIEPYPDYIKKSLYRYLLLELFFEQAVEVYEFIDRFVKRRILLESDLVDRVHMCPYCSSAHINYIDICPECHSIDIQDAVFIHCFSCGNVTLEDDCKKGERLICNKCNEPLKHIGVDYDHPVENQICNNCSRFFVDEEIICRCFYCFRNSEIDQLIVKNIYSYQLSDEIRYSLKNLSADNLSAILELQDDVVFDKNKALLEWYFAVSSVNRDINFAAIYISVENFDELYEQYDVYTVNKVFKKSQELINQLLNKGDISEVVDRKNILVFIPQYQDDSLNELIDRSKEIIKQVGGDITLQISLSIYKSKDQERTVATVEDLVKILKNEVSVDE